MQQNILITGITGQDGLYLTRKLVNDPSIKKIYGTTRKPSSSSFFEKLSTLDKNIDLSKIALININFESLNETSSFFNDINVSNVYNLMGPSSVYKSLIYPELYKIKLLDNTLNIIKSLISLKNFPSFFQASSSEMFEISKDRLTEESNFLPRNPYSETKLKIHKLSIKLRKKYDWNITSGIMFNHESHFRENDFLFKKIINYCINNKFEKALKIGSLDIERDWSHSEEFVDAMELIIKKSKSGEYIISSGTSNKISDLLEIIFKYFDKNYQDYIVVDNNLLREGDPISITSCPKKIYNELGWNTKLSFEDVVVKIIEDHLKTI